VPPAIVYLHGFKSAPASTKATQLGAAVAAMPAATRPRYAVPSLDPHPLLAMRDVIELADTLAPDHDLTFVGSSLGGYYANYLANRYACKAVLINPAIHPERSLEPYLGVQRNLYTGEPFEVRREHFVELTALRIERLPQPDRVYLLVQTGDELLDWRDAATYCAGGWQFVQGGGDHAFQDFPAVIPSILRFAGAT
jgi:predicted esterase YcpF (UPF0227 family)